VGFSVETSRRTPSNRVFPRNHPRGSSCESMRAHRVLTEIGWFHVVRGTPSKFCVASSADRPKFSIFRNRKITISANRAATAPSTGYPSGFLPQSVYPQKCLFRHFFGFLRSRATPFFRDPLIFRSKMTSKFGTPSLCNVVSTPSFGWISSRDCPFPGYPFLVQVTLRSLPLLPRVSPRCCPSHLPRQPGTLPLRSYFFK
jgi:hypothetical protein